MSVCFVVPYFGKFPEWFPFWLESCKHNSKFSWLIFTDDNRKFDYPENVRVIYETLTNLERRFSDKLGFEIKINSAYKLCDYKALYGFLFEDELKEFTHWGYTDVDTIFGDLSKFITDEMLNQYDKIQEWGHLSIYKNEESINNAFMECNYKKILECEASFIFDEPSRKVNINRLLKDKGKKILAQIKYADIKAWYSNFKFVDSVRRVNNHLQNGAVIEYRRGKVYLHYLNNGMAEKDEFAYVHFQKRKVVVDAGLSEKFLLVPNKIIQWEPIDECFLKQYEKSETAYYLKRMWNRLSWRIKNEWLLRKDPMSEKF